MSSVSVRYDLTLNHDIGAAEIIATNNTCILPPWSLHDGEGAAKTIAKEHMRDIWNDYVSEDDDCPVLITIRSPDDVKGTYEMSLSKAIVATECRKQP